MAFAGLWGAIPQSEGVAQAAEAGLEKIDSKSLRAKKDDSDSTDESSNVLDKEHADEEVLKLARQVTQYSIKSAGGTYQNPFDSTDDPALNPQSDQFKPEAWVHTIMGYGTRISDFE